MYSGFERLLIDIQHFFPRIPELIFSLIVGILVVMVVLALLSHGLRLMRFPKALTSIIYSLASVVLWVILVAHLLRTLGLSQVAITLSGSLLVIGLAVANGAHALVADMISGLFLAKDPDFDIGYKIKSGEIEGEVESIDIRKTRIRQKNGTLVMIPNSVIDKERLVILDRPSKRARTTTKMEEIHFADKE